MVVTVAPPLPKSTITSSKNDYLLVAIRRSGTTHLLLGLSHDFLIIIKEESRDEEDHTSYLANINSPVPSIITWR